MGGGLGLVLGERGARVSIRREGARVSIRREEG